MNSVTHMGLPAGPLVSRREVVLEGCYAGFVVPVNRREVNLATSAVCQERAEPSKALLRCYTNAVSTRSILGTGESTSNMTAQNCLAFCARSTYVGVEFDFPPSTNDMVWGSLADLWGAESSYWYALQRRFPMLT